MHASARLALIFTLGLYGGLSAAESLPPLRVDPALLGGSPASKPVRPPAPPAAEAKPAQVLPQAQPERDEIVARPAAGAPAQPGSKPAVSVAKEATPPVPPAPAGAAKTEPRKEPAVAARAAAPREAPKAAAPADVRPLPQQPPQEVQPPLVEERPALPPLYSAHADAGLVPALKPAGQLSPLQVDKKADYPTFIAASRRPLTTPSPSGRGLG